MNDLALVYLELLLISPRFLRRNGISFLLCIYALSILPSAVTGDRSAFIDIEGNRLENDQSQSGSGQTYNDNTVNIVISGCCTKANEGNGNNLKSDFRSMESRRMRLRGSYVRAGTVKSVEGILKKIPIDDCVDENDQNTDAAKSTGLSHDWVAVLEVPAGRAKAEHHTSECQSVLDKVKKAMLLGASAIIILAMNPKMVTELDISQLFPRPVVLIKEVENVTALLSALASKISMKVRLTYNASFYDLQNISTLTFWTTCGRSSAVRSYGTFDGVICLDTHGADVSKEDPGEFWSYFFSGLSILILLFLIKARHCSNDMNSISQAQNSIERLSRYAINQMKVRRYKNAESRNHDDSDRDTCAVCLDAFNKKQKIRVLPCFHEFHMACVDPWLLGHQTCPLCKLNIIDQQMKTNTA